jgi:signal transduction histidine kinase
MTENLSTREAARFDLIRRSVSDDETLSRAFQHALRLSAHTLGIARVGLWLFEAKETRIRCVALYSLEHGLQTGEEAIDLATCPHYARALYSRRVVAADDARSDARTSELGPYLARHGITSLLDSPVFQKGEPFGIVCHEHVGPARAWTQQDTHFAATVADMIGLYCEQRATQRYYHELIETRRVLEEHRVMESLGRFSAAIAHDFNNVLGAIGLQAELLETVAQKNEAALDCARQVVQLVDQGSRLVRQLSDFARHEPSSDAVTNLVDVVRGVEPLVRTFERRGITCTLELPNESVPVLIEQSRAEQVLMNLVVNARDALLGGGRLTIALSVREADRRQEAVLRVSDSGVGMDAQTRERMFEPFFTTKPVGQGQGLGLATVYRIVSASGGTIEVRSEPSAGTDFVISWPLAAR